MEAQGGTVLLRDAPAAIANAGFVTAGIVDVTERASIPDEEWFGPLLQVIRVARFRRRHRGAPTPPNSASPRRCWRRRKTLWKRFAVTARAGIVNWNRPTTGAASSAPFGGVGKSGNHRPSAYYAADYCAYPVASIETRDWKCRPNCPPA